MNIEMKIREEAENLFHKLEDESLEPPSILVLRYLEKAVLVGCGLGKTEDFEMVDCTSPEWPGTE